MDKKEIAMEKEQFLRDIAMANSIQASLQHAGIYADGLTDEQRRTIRKAIAAEILTLVPQYKNKVTDQSHCDNIRKLSDKITKRFDGQFKDKYRIGIAQKALNLYLKFLWCLGDIPTPPHCPIDSYVIERLYGKHNNIRWTQIDGLQQYCEIICRYRLTAEKTGISLSEWENEVYNHRSN